MTNDESSVVDIRHPDQAALDGMPPAVQVDFDIAAEEARVQQRLAEQPDFTVKLPSSGKVLTLINARRLDWRQLQGVGADPVAFIAHVITEEDDQRAFLDAPMSAETMRLMMKNYFDHYGMDVNSVMTGSDATVEHLQAVNRRRKRSKRR